jgi:2'-5' RNA ligase
VIPTEKVASTLARRNSVELIRTGSWAISSGSWTPTRADILAAVEAQSCPAIRNPQIKLGHIDPRFDGQPAMGWFENLRAADGGHTLVADQVTLPWLDGVQAAAYPDRSVEGNYRHKCGLGHTHPFVITAVALLGVTPPGVSTLRSLQDLPDMLGVAASQEVPEGAEHVQVTIRAAADDSDEDDEAHAGAMVALIPTVDDAQRLAVPGGEPAEQLHVTLAYLGEAAALDPAARQDIIDAVSTAVNGTPVVEASGFSVAIFNPPHSDDDGDPGQDTCIVLGLSGDELDAVHEMVCDELQGIDLPPQHQPWVAHTTLIYTADLTRAAALVDRTGPVTFDRVRIAFAGVNIDIPLIDYAGQVADETPADWAPGWAADPGMVAAAADQNSLKKYWLVGDGATKWKTWTELYNHIRKFVAPDKAKRMAAQWFHERYGMWPGSKANKGVKAGAGNGAPPMPSRAERIRAAWNTSGAPHSQWVQEARVDAAVVVDDTDAANRTYQLYPVTFDGDQVSFGDPQPYDPAADQVLVFASAAESRPAGTTEAAPESPPPADSSAPVLPAAEPEPEITDPKEDLVSTDLSAFRSRLGLDDTADEAAVTAAIDALKAKAEAPAEPTPEMVAASAATEAEKGELRKEVQVLASRMEQVTAELAATKAQELAIVKASVFDAAVKNGQIKPADREQWEKDYDEAPAAVTRVLASIAVGAAVPVLASGIAGSPEPAVDDEFEALISRIDSPTGKVA